MNYLTLDTNTWIYIANGTEPVKLLNFIKREVERRSITILIPQIILEEWERNKESAIKQGIQKHVKGIQESLDRILKLLGQKGERDVFSFLLTEEDEGREYFKDFIENFEKKRKEIDDAIAENIRLIEELFKHETTIVIPIPDTVFLKAGKYALDKKAPFRNRNSFADALIIFSFIDYVKTHGIENAFFISYNTDDFCEKKNGKNHFHPDLVPDFDATKSFFFTTLGEALNTIEKDIVTQAELQWIKEMQEEAEREREREIEYCQVCQENSYRNNEVHFERPHVLVDERGVFDYDHENQGELPFIEEPPQPTKKYHYNSIKVGFCDWCNTEHFVCVECGELNALWDNDYNKRIECMGCGLPYFVRSSRFHREDPEKTIYIILKYTEICQKCGDEFEPDGTGNNVCNKCENEYAYGEK